MPPLHHEVVTARVRVDRADLADAQQVLETALAGSRGAVRADARRPRGHARLGTAVLRAARAGWRGARMRRSTGARRRAALLPARRFASDPESTLLEENDVAVLLRSDHLDHIADGAKALFDELDLFDVTSIRKGFAGGGFEGGRSLPKQMAVAAGVPGAELIPDTAELFLGFTSTQSHGPRASQDRQLRDARLRRSAVAATSAKARTCISRTSTSSSTRGTSSSTFVERVDTVFRPGLDCRRRHADGAPGAGRRRDPRADRAGFRRDRTIGHSAAIQTASRLQADHVARDGTVYRKGTAIPHRADFNTLDNPFFWSADPSRDGMSDEPSAGVHFVVFNPTSDDFERVRNAMDGVVPGRRRGSTFPRATAARDSTRCSRRRIGRTSSCRRAATARFPASRASAPSTRGVGSVIKGNEPERPLLTMRCALDTTLPSAATRVGRRRSGPKKALATSYQLRGTVFSSAVASCSEDVDDRVALQRGHPAPRAREDEVCGLEPVTSGEHAVARRRGAAALNVAENGHARLVAGSRFDLARECVADSAKPNVPELIGRRFLRDLPLLARLVRQLVPLGDDDDREVLAAARAVG